MYTRFGRFLKLGAIGDFVDTTDCLDMVSQACPLLSEHFNSGASNQEEAVFLLLFLCNRRRETKIIC